MSSDLQLNHTQRLMLLSLLNGKRDELMRKADTLRKMKDWIDADLYEFFRQSHNDELKLVQDIIMQLHSN